MLYTYLKREEKHILFMQFVRLEREFFLWHNKNFNDFFDFKNKFKTLRIPMRLSFIRSVRYFNFTLISFNVFIF